MPGEVIPRKILILIHLFCTSTSSNSSCSLLFHRLKRRSPVRTVLPMKTLSGNGIRTKHNFPSPLLLSLLLPIALLPPLPLFFASHSLDFTQLTSISPRIERFKPRWTILFRKFEHFAELNGSRPKLQLPIIIDNSCTFRRNNNNNSDDTLEV